MTESANAALKAHCSRFLTILLDDAFKQSVAGDQAYQEALQTAPKMEADAHGWLARLLWYVADGRLRASPDRVLADPGADFRQFVEAVAVESRSAAPMSPSLERDYTGFLEGRKLEASPAAAVAFRWLLVGTIADVQTLEFQRRTGRERALAPLRLGPPKVAAPSTGPRTNWLAGLVAGGVLEVVLLGSAAAGTESTLRGFSIIGAGGVALVMVWMWERYKKAAS